MNVYHQTIGSKLQRLKATSISDLRVCRATTSSHVFLPRPLLWRTNRIQQPAINLLTNKVYPVYPYGIVKSAIDLPLSPYHLFHHLFYLCISAYHVARTSYHHLSSSNILYICPNARYIFVYIPETLGGLVIMLIAPNHTRLLS